MIQDMHLAALIMIFLALILVIGFLISHCTLKRQIKSRRRPSSTILLCKSVLALWFILAAVSGSLLIAGPALFFKNYEKEEENFFGTKKGTVTYKYGAGFAITIVGGASLLVSTLLGLIVFVTIVRKMCRLSAGDAKDEFDNLDANDTEMERLSNDGLDDHMTTSQVTHKKAMPVAAPRKQYSSDEQPEDRSYMNIPKRQSQRQRDADAGLSYQNIPTPRPKSSVNAGAPPQPAKRMSTHNPDRQRDAGPPDNAYQAQYNGRGSPTPGARSMAGESMASTAYPPSTHYSYSPRMETREPHSDVESTVRGGRNRTITKANPGDTSSVASSNVQRPVVIQAGRTPDAKHSRYAAMY